MRIIVMSDTHKKYSSIEKIVFRNMNADMFIHLGDGEDDVDLILDKFPELSPRFIHVRGNCDYGSLNGYSCVIPVESHKIYAAHGHLLGVNFGVDNMEKIAKENNCDIMLYGHTHCRFMKYDDGMYIMNPGSASSPRDGSKPSYGYIDITDAGIITNIVDL